MSFWNASAHSIAPRSWAILQFAAKNMRFGVWLRLSSGKIDMCAPFGEALTYVRDSITESANLTCLTNVTSVHNASSKLHVPIAPLDDLLGYEFIITGVHMRLCLRSLSMLCKIPTRFEGFRVMDMCVTARDSISASPNFIFVTFVTSVVNGRCEKKGP